MTDSRFTIPTSELAWRFGPSGGPGGQHANTANTKAVVSWNIAESEALTEPQRDRLISRLGTIITVAAEDTRSQARNRDLAVDRLTEKVRASLQVQRNRRPTKPSKGAKRRRLDAKRQRSETKKQRQRPPRYE